MPDPALWQEIQAAISGGYAIAAEILAPAHAHYRPSGPLDPISPGNLLGALPASFDANNYLYSRPNLYGKPTWTGLWDGAQTQPGDYLIGPQGTWFIAAQQPLLPMVAVSCNEVLDLWRPDGCGATGALGYGGATGQPDRLVARGWPASVLTKGRGDKGDLQLPGDVRTPWAEVLLPPIPGTAVQFADTLINAGGIRHKVSSFELTDLGWRLLCLVAVP